MLAVKFERRLALDDLADDRNVYPGAQQRLAERHAAPALHDLRAGRPDSHKKRFPDIACKVIAVIAAQADTTRGLPDAAAITQR
jgi:hypothetical protein